MTAPERPLAVVTFDLEEFDLPAEHGRPLPPGREEAVTADGLDVVLDVLDDAGAVATFFTTVRQAEARPDQLRRVAERHEIASHGMHHGALGPGDLTRSRERLEDLSGRPVRAYRSPRMAHVAAAALLAAGYTIDSSEHPTWVPGRYNNLRAPRGPRREGGLLRVPASVTPLVRFPLFWLSFRHAPRFVTRLATSACLAHDGFACFYLHPWEFVDLSGLPIPWYVRRGTGAPMRRRLEAHLAWLSGRARFGTLSDLAARLG